ncbi:MAG TPA: hypothetical protein VGC89_19065 [Pyrinomonadaceae bacterium]|jgi:hypothetical protein
MERRPTTRGGARLSRRLKIFLWIAGLAIVTISLIVFEQTAILYVLATLGVTALLVIVALADLSGANQGVKASELGDDAASIANAIPASSTAAAAAAIKSPATASRRPSRSRAKRRS